MPTETPAADRLAAKLKAARELGLWGVEMTTQEADMLIGEARRLAVRIAELEGRAPERPDTCGAYSKPGLGGILGPCTKPDGHDAWHLDQSGAAWNPVTDGEPTALSARSPR